MNFLESLSSFFLCCDKISFLCSLKPPVCMNDDHKNQSLTYVDTLAREDAKLNMGASVNIPIPQTEVAKTETAVQKTSQHSIPSGVHNYSGPTPIPQIVSRKTTYEQLNVIYMRVQCVSAVMLYYYRVLCCPCWFFVGYCAK